MKSLFFLLLATFSLASCGKYADGTSVWAGGAWLVFWLPFLASFVFFYFAWRASNSGSKKQVDLGTPNARTEYSDENVAIWKTPQFWIGVVLQIVAWAVVIYQNANK